MNTMKHYANFIFVIFIFTNCGNENIIKENNFPKIENIELRDMFLEVNNEDNLFYRMPLRCTNREMTQILEEPDLIQMPEYECGRYSIHKGKSYTQYFYGNLNFIGNIEVVEIEKMIFVNDARLVIQGKRIHGGMTRDDVLLALDIDDSKGTEDGNIFIYPRNKEGYFYLELMEGKLYKLERFYSC